MRASGRVTLRLSRIFLVLGLIILVINGIALEFYSPFKFDPTQPFNTSGNRLGTLFASTAVLPPLAQALLISGLIGLVLEELHRKR
jgi:hypothetical protein